MGYEFLCQHHLVSKAEYDYIMAFLSDKCLVTVFDLC